MRLKKEVKLQNIDLLFRYRFIFSWAIRFNLRSPEFVGNLETLPLWSFAKANLTLLTIPQNDDKRIFVLIKNG